MPLHEHLHIGQVHAFPRHVLLPSAAKRLEDFGDILCGNAAPVIADMQHGDVGTAFACHDDLAGAVGITVDDTVL
jgi:hypothetical protein